MHVHSTNVAPATASMRSYSSVFSMPLAPVPAQAPASAKPLVPYKDSYVSHDLSSLSIYDLDDVIVDDSQRAAQVDVAMASSLSIQSMAVDASS